MALTNEQFDIIMRNYEKRQRDARIARDHRYREVVEKIPAFLELDARPGAIAASCAARLASGDDVSAGVASAKEALLSVKAKKEALLAAAGFPADYLEPVYICADCRDTGFTDGTKCHCFRRQEIDLLYAQSNLNALTGSIDFSRLREDFYQGDAEDLQHFRGARDGALQFVDRFPGADKGLLFMGSVGTGKTALSVCIAGALLERGYSVLYFSAVALFEQLAKAHFSKEHDELSDRLLDDLFTRDLLIIDDLGSEMTNSFVVEQLFLILNERGIRQKPLVVSTNLQLRDLQSRYEDRVFSRITGQCAVYRLTRASDIRQA